jgi:serine/threonine protein kinase
VTVFDLGENDGQPFIVMELLEGMSLPDYLRTEAAQSVDAKIDLMMQVCQGLQNAHLSGVIHRDVKPSNMLVQSDGTLKILDFGVARLTTSNLTASGFLVGTPEYMSPEQTQGRRVDARSDVFSAACVFYFMLTGRSPFGAGDLREMLRKIISDEPAPLTEEDAPEALVRVLKKALAKAPEARYQQCAELLEDLDRTRRNYHGATYRVLQAALDRYRQTLVTIEERRALGRSLGVVGIDSSCDEDAARLKARFPLFAAHADSSALMEPIDRVVANAALEALQARHNAELAAVAAMRDAAVDVLQTPPPATPAGAPGGPDPAAADPQATDDDRNSWKTRATSFLRGLTRDPDEDRSN